MLVAMLLFSVVVLLLTRHFHRELRSLGHAGLLGLFAVSLIGNATVIIPVPAFVMACASASVYGALVSGVVSGLGAGLGELTGYFAGLGGNAILPQTVWVRRLEGFIRKQGFLTVFALAAIPNPAFDLGGMLAGMCRMSVWHFLIACILGKTLRFILVGLGCIGFWNQLVG